MSPGDNASQRTILVVEDEMDMRFFLATLLKTNGFSAVMAKDGIEGMRRAHETPPDAIIMDVMMPKEGGALMYRKLRADESLGRIPVLVLSGVEKSVFYHYLAMLSAETGGQVPPPDAYAEKPPEPEEILSLLRSLLNAKDTE